MYSSKKPFMRSDVMYSIVVPVYNSAESLKGIVDRVEEVFTQQVKEPYEIIFVDDGSPNPQTWQTLSELSTTRNHVKAIRLMRNFGQQASTICGLREAKGEHIFTLDDDLQHDPYDMPAFIEHKDHDIVIAQFRQKQHTLAKRFFSKFKSKFDEVILGKPKHIQLSPYRLINRVTIDGMLSLTKTPYPFIPAMMFYVTKDVVGVNVEHHARAEGSTGYNYFKMLKLFSNLLINNSSLLLRLIGNLGLIISFCSFLVAGIYVYRKLFLDINALGWTSLFVALLFIGGLLLFSVGIMGEYLIRIIQGIDQKPNYLIREVKTKETARTAVMQENE